MALSWLNILVMIMSIDHLIYPTNAQISTPCSAAMVSKFTPCLNFVTSSSNGGSSPTQDCCNAVKALATKGVDCMCLIVTGNVPLSVPFINQNLAISLPRLCSSSVPLKCKASGDPLPAPGPALLGPTSAPSDTVSQEDSGDAPLEAGGSDIAPVEPSEPPEKGWFGPTQIPWMRPVVNPNSSTCQSTATWAYVVLLLVGIISVTLLL